MQSILREYFLKCIKTQPAEALIKMKYDLVLNIPTTRSKTETILDIPNM